MQALELTAHIWVCYTQPTPFLGIVREPGFQMQVSWISALQDVGMCTFCFLQTEVAALETTANISLSNLFGSHWLMLFSDRPAQSLYLNVH